MKLRARYSYISKILIILFFVLATLFTPFIVTAEGPESFHLTPQKTLPGSALYPFKRIKEKIIMVVTFSAKEKARYGIVLLEKRLSELASLVDRKDATYLESSAQRFAAQAGVLANHALTDDKEMKELVLSYFEGYKPVLEQLRDNYPANYAYWLSIQQDIDTLNILSEQLK
ncbi:MAG: DUF5667 domain-containing protein [Patescibacteria group bacterium]